MPPRGAGKQSPPPTGPGGAASLSPQSQTRPKSADKAPLLAAHGQERSDASPVGARAGKARTKAPSPTIASPTDGLPRHLRCDRTIWLRVLNWVIDLLDGDEGFDQEPGQRRRLCTLPMCLCCCCCLLVLAIVLAVAYAIGTSSFTLTSVVTYVQSAASAAPAQLAAAWAAFSSFMSGSTLSEYKAYASDMLLSSNAWLWTGLWSDTTIDIAATIDDMGTCPDGLVVPGPVVSPAGTVYTLAMLFWMFYGVSIGADLFMEAIETITSQEVLTYVPLPGGARRPLTVRVWNATVANLTLMALGSSAPEILLSVIEICGSSFYSGELGPSTIVGSAAFNLMVISAVCVTALPEGEGRYIKQQGVFMITAFFSVFAYLWLVLILVYVSPNVIDVWEGLLTLAYFPILVYLAYLADIGKINADCLGCGGSSGALKVAAESAVDPRRSGKRPVEVLGGGGVVCVQRHSAAYYRMNATREATGGATNEAREELKLQRAARAPLTAGYLSSTLNSKARKEQTATDATQTGIELGAAHFAARDTDGWANVAVFRSGSLAAIASVGFSVVSGSADTVEAEGRVVFEPTQQRATIRIQLLPEDVSSGGDTLSVRLDEPSRGVLLGATTRCAVRVIGGDAPGVICLENDSIVVKESAGYASLTLTREEGSHGVVSCTMNTKDGSAVAPADYAAIEDEEVVFAHGETRKAIKVHIVSDEHFEGDEDFSVVFSDATGGASFSEIGDGGPERAIAKVLIECDDVDTAHCGDALLVRCGVNVDQWQQVGTDWYHQFVDAIAFDRTCSLGQLIFYLLALPWRLGFALAPPPRLAGGWACFIVALAMIGGLTALVGDYASNLGCCLGISKSVTAITFVALGTSLPDTFASMTAAKSEPHADNSLGNITGSNSVNVFLGLGLPWGIAAVYWAICGSALEGEWRTRYESEPWYDPSMAVAFAVPAGSLGYSVIVFSGCAVVTLAVLFLRRAVLGFELGGPTRLAQATAVFFVFLWLVYIVLSVMRDGAR